MTPEITLADTAPAPPRRAGRHFIGWDRHALRTTATLLAGRYAAGAELRMDGATVVLPGARATRHLKEHLLEFANERGLRLIPPRVTTLGALPELLYRPQLPHLSDALSRRLWTRALRRLPSERLDLLYQTIPPTSDILGWSRLARAVAALHREVSGAGLRFAEVARLTTEGLLFSDTERWSVLAELQASYEADLRHFGFSDRGLARIDALAAGTLSIDQDLWLVGVIEMPRVLMRMLETAPEAATRLTVIVQAPESEAADFDALGCLRTDGWSTRSIPLRDSQLAVRDGPAEQTAEVGRFLASLGGEYAADEILVAAPDETLIPFLEQGLGEVGVRTHAAAGLSIDRSPVLRLLAGIADFLDGHSFDAGAALVRHPDVGRWLRDHGRGTGLPGLDTWLESLDGYFSEHLPARLHPPLPGTMSGNARRVGELLDALAGEKLLGRFRGTRTDAQWMPEVIGLLVEVFGRTALDISLPANRRVMEACQSLRAAAVDLMMLPEELAERSDGPTAIRLLLDEVSDLSLAPDPDRDAVELLGWLELRLDDAPVAVVTGFNEPVLPQSVNAHPWLPNALRERIGLVGNARRYARDAYELTALARSREQLRMIAGRRSSTGDPLRPSRLAFAVEGATLARRVEQFYSAETATDGGPEETVDYNDPTGGRQGAEVGAGGHAGEGVGGTPRSGFTLPPEPLLRAPAPIEKLRVTDFRQLIADPYGFALERILGLAPLDDTARELDGPGFGSLAHGVLERFARSEDAHATDLATLRARLDALLDAAARERFGTHSLPAIRIQVEQLRARLHAFAALHAAWIADGWRIVGVECSTPPEGVPFDVDGQPIRLSGRIDRIDYHPERRIWALLDYKTGDAGDPPEVTHCSGKGDPQEWIDLQLPLYRHLLPHLPDLDLSGVPFPPRDEEIGLGYITLPRDLRRTGVRFAQWTPEMLADADLRARDIVRFLRRNEFTFDPVNARKLHHSPLSSLFGIAYLESAADVQEDDS